MRHRPSPDTAADARRPTTRPEQDAAQAAVARTAEAGHGTGRTVRRAGCSASMPERLRDALAEYRRTRSHEGRRRQLQYVGKLMRDVDEAPLREAVAASKLGSAKDTLLLHEAERWRDELVADDEALTRWLHEYPDSDPQRLRSLVRAARARGRRCRPSSATAAAHRELFQFIRPLLTRGHAVSDDSRRLDVPSNRVRIGLVSVSDRAASGVYADQGIPALQDWLGRALRNPIPWETRLIPDEQAAHQRHAARTGRRRSAATWC